jgi:hypothetical protein
MTLKAYFNQPSESVEEANNIHINGKQSPLNSTFIDPNNQVKGNPEVDSLFKIKKKRNRNKRASSITHG